MESVVPKYGVITCPDCENLINSYAPVCSDCGLTMSELEVISRAELDEHNRKALLAANYLYGYATVAVVYFYLALILGAIVDPGMAFGQIFVSAIAVTLFWWRYFDWGRRYAKNPTLDEMFAEALDARRRTLLIGIALSGLVFVVISWSIS